MNSDILETFVTMHCVTFVSKIFYSSTQVDSNTHKTIQQNKFQYKTVSHET